MTDQTARRASPRHLGVDEDVRLRELADVPVFTVFQQVASSPRGLTEQEAADRLRRFGDNEPFRAADDGLAVRIVAALRSPFVALLAGLGVVFVAVADARGAVTVAVMVTPGGRAANLAANPLGARHPRVAGTCHLDGHGAPPCRCQRRAGES